MLRNLTSNAVIGQLTMCRLGERVLAGQLTRQMQPHRLLQQTAACFGVKGTEIKMPVLSPTMSEGKIVKWLKQEGDTISPGDVICEVQTDKAVVAMEMEEEGILAKILVPEDSKDVKIGELIALMVEEGQDWKDVEIPAVTAAPAASPPAATPAAAKSSSDSGSAASTSAAGKAGERIGPSARNLLQQYQIQASQVPATGPHNILLKSDVLNYIESQGLKPKSAAEQAAHHQTPASTRPTSQPSTAGQASVYTDIELTNMRRTIAKRLTESKTTIPHSYMSIDCNVNQVIDYRKHLKQNKTNISVNDIIIKAAAVALKKVPQINAIFDTKADRAIPQASVDISIAVATPNGLITPIIKNANHLTITQINEQTKRLAEKAREGKLQPDEFIGGSFSISNLGMFGIAEFSAVINPPQAAILAIGSPRTIVNNFDSINKLLTCTLSFDARVADEELVAEFLEEFRNLLEQPAELNKQDGSKLRRLSALA